jgi:tetratricopeptide (TPR) repeat protein
MSQAETARVFLSATTRDLGSYRGALADSLRAAGCHVEVQENFAAHPGKFLAKLRDYLAPSDVVVCLVGEHFGWQPPDAALIPSPAREAYPEPLVSATEWEFFLAGDAGCDVFLFLSAPGFVPDAASDDTPEKAAAHRRFRAHLGNSGRDCNRFQDLPTLTRDIFAAFHLRTLRRTGGHLPRVLPKAAQHFTGRADEIEWVKTQLRSQARVALIGPGGIGKTAIAHEAVAALSPEDAPFAHFPGGIFLHDFYAASGYLAAIEDIVAQAGLTDLEDREREPRARALLAGPRSLVYLEGCEKAEDLTRFLDLCGPATVLITSREKADAKGAVARDIFPMAEDEAAGMLRRHAEGAAREPGMLPGENDPGWREIARLLGRHALALRLAGHRLGIGNETPAEFLAYLIEEGFERFDDDRRTKESLDLLFSHSAEALSPEARGAWFALALHALAPIHLQPIAAALGLEEKAARRALQELIGQSLAEPTRIAAEAGGTDPAWLLSHALLPAWGKKRLRDFGVEETGLFERCKDSWLAFLDRCFDEKRVPGGPARYAALLDHFDALIEGIKAQAGGESNTLTVAFRMVGNAHRFMGRYGAAEAGLRCALAISEKLLGSEHRETLGNLYNLAILLNDKGDLAGAEPLYRRALEAQGRTLGPEHPDTLGSLNSLAVVLKDKGDLAGAEPLYRQALEARERTLGPEHLDTLMSLNNLAALLCNKGDLAGAEPLYRRALEARERTLGPEHPDALMSLNNLAALLCEKGDLAGAEPLFRQALEIRERTLGREHPATLNTVFNLALLLEEQGNLAATEPMARRAVEGVRKILLPQHPWRQTAEQMLARIQAALGKAGPSGDGRDDERTETDERARQLSGEELGVLAQQMVDATDPVEVERLKAEITKGFYGEE